MAQINPTIMSEINGLKNSSKETVDFLKWLLEFERAHIDKELYSYKEDIEKKLIQLLEPKAESDTP
jgi:hypothetical protein